MKYLAVGDFVVIAREALRPALGSAAPTDAELAEMMDVHIVVAALRAPSATVEGEELYVGLAAKAAVLCVRLARTRPLPYGNTAVAYVAMREMIARNGGTWNAPAEDEAMNVLEAMAIRRLSEADFILWVAERLR